MDTSLLPKEPTEQPKVAEDFDKINFDLSPDRSRGKIVITTYGQKGAGKTTGLFLITTGRLGGFPPGKTFVISFDNKTKITAEQYFPNEDITTWDGKQHYREDPTLCTKSGMMSYKFIQKLILSWRKDPPDWIVFDGFTIMALILEMSMRYMHGLQPSQGISNLNVWKDRARFIQDLHNLAIKTARYGVAYTTYSEKDEIVEAGTTISKTDVPKYIDVIMQETDVVLHATKAKGKDGNLFYMRVESTKFKQYVDMNGNPLPFIKDVTLEDGRTYNITKLTEVPSKKPIQAQPLIQSKLQEQPKVVDVEKHIESVKVVEKPILQEQVKPIEPIKLIEVVKPIDVPKPIEIKLPEIIQQKVTTQVETKKTWLVPNLLSL